jgi:soluble lytic murein transglycosylase-like protein
LRALLFLLVSHTIFAGEYAVLTSGTRLHADRHETEGAKIRLYTGDGYVELDAAQVSGFEPEQRVAEPATAIRQAAAPLLSPEQLADQAADKYGLPRQLVRSVMSAESGYQQQAVSPKGAIGLMQLMPETAQTLGVDAHDAAQNTDAGARYLRELLEKYHGALFHALAAYNAGPAAVDKYQGIPPFRETIQYVNRIAGEWKKAGMASGQ